MKPMRGKVVLFLGWVAGAGLAAAQTVDVWLTTQNQSSKLQQQASLTFTNGIGGNNPVVVDEARIYQEVEASALHSRIPQPTC